MRGTGMLSDSYGGAPATQPNALPVATHAPGTPEPQGRTVPEAPAGGLASPAFMIVVFLALAILMTQVAFRGVVEVEL